MSLEAFNYIDSLNSANPTTTDNVSEGDDHIRGIKSTLKTTFPNITGALTPTHTELNYVDGVTSAIQTQLDTHTTNISSKLPLAGGTLTGNVSLGDNVKAKFGASDDLQIYHSGTNSFISEQGTGNLVLRADEVTIVNAANTETKAHFISDGEAALYHDNVKKLKTTSTGIDVTGSVTCDSLGVAGTLGTVSVDSQGALMNFSRPSISYISATDVNGGLALRTGGSVERLRIDSSGNVGIGTSTLSSNKAVIEGGVAGTNSSTLALKTGSGANSKVADLAFYGTFVTPTSDSGQRRTADITSGFSTANWGTEYLAFGVGGAGDAANLTSEKMRITSAGRVGIGTSSPVSPLTVTAADGVAVDQYVARLTNSEATAGQNYGLYVAGGSNSSDESFSVRNFDNSSTYFKVRGDGNVGIGTSSPSAKLDVTGNITQNGSFSNTPNLAGYSSESKRWLAKLASSATTTVATVTSVGHGGSQLSGFYLTYTYRSSYGFNGNGGGHGLRMISGRRVDSTTWAFDTETNSAVGDSPNPTLSCTDNGDGTASLKVVNPGSTHSFGELHLMVWDCSIV